MAQTASVDLRCVDDGTSIVHPFPSVERIQSDPEAFLSAAGEIFAVFDSRTQDSGNISYGVETGAGRFFVKTAGLTDDRKPFFHHDDRARALRNAARLADSSTHRALPKLRQVIESATGPMLVYDWVDGELVRGCLPRVRCLHAPEIVALLTEIYSLHLDLSRLGWVAVDFYDGSMLYDFERRRVHAIDLDSYHLGPFTNRMGRMFGSTRFMAPEEYEMGAAIDQRTTVFTLGRAALILLSDNSLERNMFRGTEAQRAVALTATAQDPDHRFQTVEDMYTAWMSAIGP